MNVAKVLKETLTIILAGGQGERLYPLTRDRAKPSVPFAGHYRIIDFTLSNCINSGLKRIYVLTQYKSQSLDDHLRLGWNIFASAFDEFLFSVPPQLRTGSSWYQGTADAVFQNLYILRERLPSRVLILSGDHIYKMDYSEMIAAHVRTGAAVTIAAAECDLASARRLGVLEIDEQNRILAFEEKPDNPKPIPGRPGFTLVNMGVYLFETDVLIKGTSGDSCGDSLEDFGRDILPHLVQSKPVFAYPFRDDEKGNYWRDIGTLDSYYEASMDLLKVDPEFNLYDTSFPIHSSTRPRPPAKMVFAGGETNRKGVALDSLLCNGCIISGGRVERSILSPDVRINSYSLVEDSILFDRVEVGRRARIRRAIIDKAVMIPPGFSVGYDLEEDAKRFTVTESGVVVIPKGARIGEEADMQQAALGHQGAR
ncbi:MAG: glucose-1-phosphate adenylyltransferase [Acidobacteriia bacterium]|nr:glucose-1-phosphate adenylyltransferase [Terriglobia bacterium]